MPLRYSSARGGRGSACNVCIGVGSGVVVEVNSTAPSVGESRGRFHLKFQLDCMPNDSPTLAPSHCGLFVSGWIHRRLVPCGGASLARPGYESSWCPPSRLVLYGAQIACLLGRRLPVAPSHLGTGAAPSAACPVGGRSARPPWLRLPLAPPLRLVPRGVPCLK